MLNQKKKYNPDVLDCIANLSNDEVFSSPKLANEMLDMLPQELFSDKNAKFLDVACKSGVFLREIVKRLDKGLSKEIPDRQERIDHILHEQVYGIAITELTAQLSRRTVYCSKYAGEIDENADSSLWEGEDGRVHIAHSYSITQFTNKDVKNGFCRNPIQGNIRYNPDCKHEYKNGTTCIYCGANKDTFKENKYAYEFIHMSDEMLERLKNMQFDLIISNPPYQMNVGNSGGNASKSKAIYHKFIEQSIKLRPRYLTMITPSRWMTKTADGIPSDWVSKMIKGNHISEIHDYADAKDCFSGVEIKGGVSYFLWDQNQIADCKYFYINTSHVAKRVGALDPFNADIIIRQPQAHSIIQSICNIEGDYFNGNKSFAHLVSPKDFFNNKKFLNSAWNGYQLDRDKNHDIKFYVSKSMKGVSYAWISKSDIPKNIESLPLHKVYIPAASGTGIDSKILGRPIYGEPNSVSSQTYLVIGYDPSNPLSEEQCLNIIKYLGTKFLRYCVSVKKMTQNGSRGSYQFVPMQDFTASSDIDWSASVDDINAQLYRKYKLSEEDIEFIETNITRME